MGDNDLGNILNKFNEMVKNNEIPDNLKDILNNFTNSGSSGNNPNHSITSNNFGGLNNSDNTSTSNSSNDSFELDMNTILKLKQIMDSMNSNKPDPRTNLLLSLKPYLKESRKRKVDQYVKLFNMEKAFETFNSLGGDSKNDV